MTDGRRLPDRPAPPAPPRRGRALAAALCVLGALCAVLARPAAAREESPIVVIPEAERADLAATIRSAMTEHAGVSRFPLPELDAEQMAKLLGGEVVRFREKWVLSREGEDDEQTRQRVLAFRLVGAPRQEAWLSALDGHFPLNDALTEVRLEEKGRGASTWYQFMDLPWPVANRHWIIHLAKSVDVCEATGGRSWEQTWRLEPMGEALAREYDRQGRLKPMKSDNVRGARYLDANDGAWAMFALRDDLSLVAYNLTIVLGGWIPEGLAARFAQRALEDLLDRVAANTAKVPGHYVAGHDPIHAGDGTAIPFYGESRDDSPGDSPGESPADSPGDSPGDPGTDAEISP